MLGRRPLDWRCSRASPCPLFWKRSVISYDRPAGTWWSPRCMPYTLGCNTPRGSVQKRSCKGSFHLPRLDLFPRLEIVGLTSTICDFLCCSLTIDLWTTSRVPGCSICVPRSIGGTNRGSKKCPTKPKKAGILPENAIFMFHRNRLERSQNTFNENI